MVVVQWDNRSLGASSWVIIISCEATYTKRFFPCSSGKESFGVIAGEAVWRCKLFTTSTSRSVTNKIDQ